jgi:dolichol-phosphate mannosyltransferase
MTTLVLVVLVLQAVLAARVVARLVRTSGGLRIRRDDREREASVAIIVPVLDERARIDSCLAGVSAQPSEVRRIVVVDGGSRDGTQAAVAAHAARDPRIRLVDASPVPDDATGKAWGLCAGLEATADDTDWILCLDADVRVASSLVRSLLTHVERSGVEAFSVAVRQHVSGPGEALVHPSLLATLVMRFGNPGVATIDPSGVQANGQCFFVRRALLRRTSAVQTARSSLCEDVTIARALAAHGVPVGFYEAGDLATASMYASWREAWRNWPRSLPMRDGFFGWRETVGLAEVMAVQALPLVLLVLAIVLQAPRSVVALEAVLTAVRLGVLVGMARAYPHRPLSYWLSPLTDLPVAIRLIAGALVRRQRWRGRSYVRHPRGWVRAQEGA